MHVAVVGGGIQGCAVALELARRDVSVSLYERRDRLFGGASRRGEGKIHLGFVYAADESLRTARLMARGAAQFEPALRRWIGDGVERLTFSAPFNYVVHARSMRTPEELQSMYRRMASVLEREFDGAPYPGRGDGPAGVRRLEPGEAGLDAYGDDVEAAFATSEVAVDPDRLAEEIVAAVDAVDAIVVRTGSRVVAADPRGRRLTVRDRAGEHETVAFDHIVNCAWDGRVALDATAGIVPPQPWSFRMKYAGRLARGAREGPPPSTTVVLGPFGDIVDYGGSTYVSWYPVCRRGWSGAVEPPAWPAIPADDEAREIVAGMGAGLAGVMPAVAQGLHDRADHVRVRGGVIYALGDTDVEDASSVLHQRSAVGPSSFASYHTVDTGKLTLAPLFALQVADRIAVPQRV